MRILVTGGAGFIGSMFVSLMVPRYPTYSFMTLDKFTYAGNIHNLRAVSALPNHRISQADIADKAAVQEILAAFAPDWVIHFAAESHVDRSIATPQAFVETNIVGTCNLLDCCRDLWMGSEGHQFVQVSTDEVYGALGECGQFTESSPLAPTSPYAASKAASDLLVQSYGMTYGLPVKLTRCSNNYGPRQFPEKLIPLMLLQALDGKPLPIYGDGRQVRDWLYVGDHCEAIWQVAARGCSGQVYNIGGNCERTNLEIVQLLCRLLAEYTGVALDSLTRLITYVPDRPAHDRRYAIDSSKLRTELGWTATVSLEQGLADTVQWYLGHRDWVEQIRSGAYRQWVAQQYGLV